MPNMLNKKGVLDFCDYYLVKLESGQNWYTALVSLLEEFSPVEFEKLLQLVSADNDLNKALLELTKFSECEEAEFFLKQLAFVSRTGDCPVGITEDTIYGIENQLYK